MTNSHKLIAISMTAALMIALPAFATGYDDYTVTTVNGAACLQCLVISAGDVDGDAQGDLMVRISDTDPATYIITATTLAGGKSIDLAKADFLINRLNRSDLLGKSIQSAGDVDKDGKDDLFVSSGDVYEEGVNEDRLINANDLVDYKFTGTVDTSVDTASDNTSDDTNVALDESRAPGQGVTVGVGVSKDISCALNPAAVGHMGSLMHALSVFLGLAPLMLLRFCRRAA